MAARVPIAGHDITSPWASEILGTAVDVERVSRIGEDYGFAGETYRVDVKGLDSPSLAVKLWRMRHSDDDRELRFYRDIAGGLPIRLPRFFAGESHPASSRGWLAMEYLADCRQGDDLVGESAGSLGRVVSVLAAIHAATSGRLSGYPWLTAPARPALDAAGISQRRVEYLDRFGPLPPGSARRLLEALPRLVPAARNTLETAPRVLVHGDVAFDNMLFAPPDEEPIIIDWQWCSEGAGVRDLASVLFTTSDARTFRTTIERYRISLRNLCADDLDPTCLDAALVLEFATRTLGVARWAPQTERGVGILDRQVRRTPQAVETWRSAEPDRFDRLLRD
ncbi:MAG: aminoglycoside phosphotransferase family protein [Acidimicrobiia bacterium]|nr:aminoglycoside phosphotransferase family protein [Acidimicrobiia bacterium]